LVIPFNLQKKQQASNNTMMAAPSDVINWEEAMQQVGDDEEFLRELLADLRSETETQLGAIAGIIQVSSFLLQYEGRIYDFFS
jgi:hypothetical protein